MPLDKKALREALRSAIEILIDQEIRLLQFEQVDSPIFVVEELTYSIAGSKRQVVKLAKKIARKERSLLIKRMVLKAVDEEIDRAIRIRQNRCLRCVHMRYYDEEGIPYVNLPIGIKQAQIIGCNEIKLASKDRCERFVEAARAFSLEDYLDEMTLFYELREMFDRFNEIWEDYFLP
jgi:hypothetical protein